MNSDVVNAKMGVTPHSQDGPSWRTAGGASLSGQILLPLSPALNPLLACDSVLLPKTRDNSCSNVTAWPRSARGTKGKAFFTFESEFSDGQRGHAGGASTHDPPTWPPVWSWRGEDPISQLQEGGEHPFAPQSSSAMPAAGLPVSELGCQPLPCLPWGLRGRLMRERRCRKHSTEPMAPGKCEASS